MKTFEDKELYKKLEELLPDYVLSNISEDDKAFFESHFSKFPDLVQEVKDGKAFFNRLEQMDFKKVFAEHTKNVSVKVHRKLEKNKRPLAFVPRFALPAIGVMMILFIVWNLHFSPANKIIQIDQTGMAVLNEPLFDDDFVIFDDDANQSIESDFSSFVDTYSTVSSGKQIIEDEADIFSDEYDEMLEFAYLESPELFWGVGSNSTISITNELNNMSEDDFQILLEELENYDNKIF